MSKKSFLILAVLVFGSLSLAATAADITGDTADRGIRSNGVLTWAGRAGERVGGAGIDGNDQCVVYVFQLPSLQPDYEVKTANLSFYFEGFSYYVPAGNADLYGLSYRTSTTILSSDFYQGPLDSDPDATLIEDNIAVPSSSPGSFINTDSAADIALVAYLNAQYMAGAIAGDFVFLRLNPDNDETNSPQRYWTFSMADHATAGQRPVLSVTSAPIFDFDAPVPDPMTWAVVPHPTGDTSVSMTATTATDESGVEYFFECTAGAGHDSGWQDGTIYKDTGLSPNTEYSYWVKARDKSGIQNETAYSSIESATTYPPDTTPPSPDPMTWASEPFATGSHSISMTATTATDDSGVEYSFECTAGGGHDCGWQDSTTYEDVGLSPSTQYSYRVKARDKSGNQNETVYSTIATAETDTYTTFYVDPVNGSMANDGSAEYPWLTLQEVFANNLIETRDKNGVVKNPGAPVKASDKFLLLSGYHGDINQSVYFNDDHITIEAAPGHTAQLKRFRLSGAKKWIIRGLDISPSHAPVFQRVTIVDLYSRSSTNGICSDIIIEDCNIYTVADWSGWTAEDCNTKACNGIDLGMDGGAGLIARGNYLLNTNFSIAVQAQGAIAEYNTIENFSGDGIRVTFHDVVARYNLIKNCYNVNDNHDDGIQSYLVNAGAGAVYRISIIGNIIINTEDPAQPYQGPMQGIGIFDGPHYDFVVKNNVVITDHWHGITLLNSENAHIVNNTVFNKWWYDGGSGLKTWIQVTSESTSGGNVVRNNIAHTIDTAGDSAAMVDHNLTIERTDNAAEWFVDYAGFDLHIASPGSPQVDVGASLLAPDEDIDGVARPQGAAFDIGAYEYPDLLDGDFTADGVVNLEDLKVLTDNWLVSEFVLNGLVSRYKFDDDAGDSVGGNDGTEVGNPTYALGKHDQAISLDGDGDYVNCGNDASFNITDAVTLSIWLKGTFNNYWDSIIQKGYNWIVFRGDGDNAAFFCLGLDNVQGTANINDNEWHHVAAVYDGSKMCLYVDGKLDAVKSVSGSLNVSTANVYIGGNTSQSFNGLVDDVRIYNRALSGSEIRTLYSGPVIDLVNDFNINFRDFAVLADNWLRLR